ncbi:MAG: DUF86 domain-containing protein [Acidobacteria bacterium]|nr:MAG: DUF86 domain-containing protein [Acidobacteriota bacterium]
MTDAELVAKKLAEVETFVRELRTLGRPERLSDDVREQRFIAHTLQLAIQAILDVASHIVSDARLGEPETLRELFDLLARDGWLKREQAATLRQIVGFRNLLVHGYAKIDYEIVRDVAQNRVDDLLDFVRSIRARIAAGG